MRRVACDATAVVVVLIVLTLAAWIAWTGSWPALGSLRNALEQLATASASRPGAFVALYSLAVVLMLPASALTIAAGALFGPGLGFLLVTLGANLGAMAAFLIARYLAREPLISRYAGSPRFQAIDRAITAQGWWFVALLRLSPLVPFNLQNYLYGLTGLPFGVCTLTSLVAMLPGTALYVGLGSAGRLGLGLVRGGTARTPAEWALLGLGFLATLVVTVVLARAARRELVWLGLDPSRASPTPENR